METAIHGQEGEPRSGRDRGRLLLKAYLERPELAGLALLVLLVAFFQVRSDGGFLSFDNLRGVLGILPEVALVAVGVTILMIAGEFDLSVGSVFALMPMSVALMLNAGPRVPGLRLQAPGTAMWREEPGHLPLGRAPCFHEPAPLPEGWINAGFEGWSGQARPLWPDGWAVRIEASPDLGRYVLHSPSGDARFVCFEPVPHAIDALHLGGGPERHGMRIPRDEERWEVECRLIPERLEEVGDGA